MPKKKTETTSKVAKKSVKKAVKKTAKATSAKGNSTKSKGTTKTNVKKSVAKTKGGKKAKEGSKKDLVFSSNDNSFWVTDGQVLNSLLALNEALNNMEKEVYSYHVTKDKHDFAEWVEVVLVDVPCATELRKAKNPNSASKVITKHLQFYKI